MLPRLGQRCPGGVVVGCALLFFLAVLAAALIKESACGDDVNLCETNDDATAMLQLRSIRPQWAAAMLPEELARETEWQEDAKHRAKKVKAFFEMCPARRVGRREASGSGSGSGSGSVDNSESELESASAPESEAMLLEGRTATSGMEEAVYGKAKCDLSTQMVLEEDTPSGVKYTCCDLSRTDCGGCASMVDKVVYKQCARCRGGYTKIPAGTGPCTACLDTVGWKDIDGGNCFNTTCSDLKVQGISSNDACCKCGGGQQAATPFTYRTDHVLLGSNSVKGGPVPRTATRYSLDMSCNLGAKGLTINGSTGELVRLPSSTTPDGLASLGADPFSESCTITAHQSPTLNYSTTLTVKASWFGYESFSNAAIVIEPASLSMSKASRARAKSVSLLGTVRHHAQEDHDQAAHVPATVVLPLLNNQFMCYSMGKWRCTYQLHCSTIQSEDWLKVDSKGSFLVEGYPPDDAPGLTGIAAWDGQIGVAGSNCELSVTNLVGFPAMQQKSKTTEVLKYDFAAVRPEVWPSFDYQTDVLRSTAGQPNPPLYVVPPKVSVAAKQGAQNGPQAYAKPTRFSMACSESPKQLSGRKSFAFDQTTGAGTLNGMPFLTLDVTAGTLRVTPGIELISVLDTLASTDVHRQLVLTCSIFAHFDFFIAAANPATSTPMTIYLEDDTCWKTVTANFLKPTTRYPATYVVASSEASCRNQCRADARCSHYAWTPMLTLVNATTNATECEFLHYRCSDIPTTDCREVTTQEKIKNCGEKDSCLRLHFEHHWDYSGWYCPKAQAGFLGWTYERTSITPEDTLWLAPFNPNRHTACAKGQWLIQRPGKTDYLDEEHFIAELDGTVRLCLDAGGDITDLALRDGTVNLTVVSSPSDPSIAAGLKMGTASIENPTCGAPNITELLNQATDETPSSDAEGPYSVVPVVLDDPTTQTPDDHWLHPCSCFSEELWGQAAPVDQSSFTDIPAGSNNQYVPKPFDIVDGEYVCEPQSLLNITILLDKQESDFDELCEDNCKQNENCTHYWLGSASSTKQCRLYEACNVLVREVGLVGKLMGMVSRVGTACRIANPNLCREVSYRREYLGASVSKQSLVPAPFSDCVFGTLLEQCDFKVLLQQLGINNCGVCSYSTQASANWAGKQPPPTGRPSGYQLEGSCWDERFTPVPVSGTGPSTLPETNWEGHQLLTCLSGEWVGPDGTPGFGNFACATCVTVAASPYRSLLNQAKQELYFTSHQVLSFFVLTSPEKKLSSNGTLILSPLDPQQSPIPERKPPDTIYGNLTSTYADSTFQKGLCLGVQEGQPVDIEPGLSKLTIQVVVEFLNGSDWEPADNVTVTTTVEASGAWRAVTGGRVFDSVPSLSASKRVQPSAVGVQAANCSDDLSPGPFSDADCQAIAYGIALGNAVGAPGEGILNNAATIEVYVEKGNETFWNGFSTPSVSGQVITIPNLYFGGSTAFPVTKTQTFGGRLRVITTVSYAATVTKQDIAVFVPCSDLTSVSVGWYGISSTPKSPGHQLQISNGKFQTQCLEATTQTYQGSQLLVPADCEPSAKGQVFQYLDGRVDALASGLDATLCLSVEGGSGGSRVVVTLETCAPSGTFSKNGWFVLVGQDGFTMSQQDCFATKTLVSECTATCGGGYEEWSVNVLSPPRGRGQVCPRVVEECNSQACDGGYDGGWLAEDFPSAAIGVKLFRSTHGQRTNCLTYSKQNGDSQFGVAACNGTDKAQQIDTAKVPAMLWEQVRLDMGNAGIVVHSAELTPRFLGIDQRFLVDLNFTGNCGKAALISALMWGADSTTPGLQTKCDAAVVETNTQEVVDINNYYMSDLIHTEDGSLCLQGTPDEPNGGSTDADTNKASGSKGPYQWLVLLKCRPELQDQRFYWSGSNLVHSKTGLCVSIYPKTSQSTTRGYATLESCSNLTGLTVDKGSPNRLKMSYSPTLKYTKTDENGDPYTVTETVGATCMGWMKVKTGSDENAVRVAIFTDCIASNSDDVTLRAGSYNPDQLRWHLGSGIISLNDWGISCKDGYALNRFQFEAGKVSYTCMAMGAVGSCSSVLSKEVDTMKQDLTQLPKLNLDCGHGALTKIHAELASGAATIKYSYTCCQLTEPATILLTGAEVTEKLPVFSGVYCSGQTRDVSGRLAYKQRSWFHTETSTTTTPVPFELFFDHLNGTWCLSGADCADSAVPYPTDNPELGTQVWQALEVTDFNYNPTPRGVGTKKRTFPTLLQFKAVQPQYARECQDDVTPGQSGFDRDQMNKVMADLPQQNPCSLVGGNAKGGMPPYKPAKSAYGDPGDPVYGVTYKDVWDCRMRQKSRNRDQLNYNQANGIATLVRTSLKGYKGLMCAVFPSVGAWAGFGGGVEANKDMGKLCAQGVDNILTTYETIQGAIKLVKQKEMFNNNGGDCEPSRHGLARVFCDLHCIRDSVRAGDAAILKSMEQASQIQTENNKMLIEYYTGLILDKMDAQSGGSGSALLQEEVKADIVAAQEYTDRLFQEMHDVVASSRLDEAGSASLSRELDFFLAEGMQTQTQTQMGGGDLERLQEQEVDVNSSSSDPRVKLRTDVARLTERTERLHAVAHGAASQGLSQKADVERRVHDFVILHEDLLASYNHNLGRFKERSHFTQALQQSLMRTIEPTLTDLAMQTEALGLEQLMLSLDSTWWELRATFDEGLQAVSEHMTALEETTALLKDYTSICALEYPELLNSFHSTMRVVDETSSKVFRVWETAVSLSGLLTSKLVDGGAFDHFARADLLSVDVQQVLSGLSPNRTRNLTPRQVSLLDRGSLCKESLSDEVAEAARLALEDAAFGPSGTGLWIQHAYQVSVVFAELEGLEHFHGPLGLEVRRQHDVEHSALRMHESIQASLARRSRLVQDAIAGFRKQHCATAQESLIDWVVESGASWLQLAK